MQLSILNPNVLGIADFLFFKHTPFHEWLTTQMFWTQLTKRDSLKSALEPSWTCLNEALFDEQWNLEKKD